MENRYPDYINDLLGPVSSCEASPEAAGTCRLAYLARCLLGEQPIDAEYIMAPAGSFARSFGHRNEDGGLLGGALGLLPDDPCLPDAYTIAMVVGMEYRFRFEELDESPSPHAIKIVLTGSSGKRALLVGDANGEGKIATRVVNGFPLQFHGDSHMVLLYDQGALTDRETADLTDLLAQPAPGKQLLQSGRIEVPGRAERLVYFATAEEPDVARLRRRFPRLRMDWMKAVLPRKDAAR